MHELQGIIDKLCTQWELDTYCAAEKKCNRIWCFLLSVSICCFRQVLATACNGSDAYQPNILKFGIAHNWKYVHYKCLRSAELILLVLVSLRPLMVDLLKQLAPQYVSLVANLPMSMSAYNLNSLHAVRLNISIRNTSSLRGAPIFRRLCTYSLTRLAYQ